MVKLFLVKGEEAQELVQKVLALATKSADNPDLRDRAYIQWRLLSSDLEAAKVNLVSRPFSGRRGEGWEVSGLIADFRLVVSRSFWRRDRLSLYRPRQYRLDC